MNGITPVYTVSELNDAIKALLESNPHFMNLSVRGELSNYKVYPSGHHYFTLKDQDSSLRCVMFRSSAQKLRFRPENGLKVVISGSLKVYPRDGNYQIYCSAILPEGTGDLQVAFEQLKQKLYSEGLFDPAHKLPIPAYPERIAMITSSAGAAVHDMIRIFGKRWPLAKLIILPVRVQGIEAPAEIAGAIAYANEFSVADLIITGRGGGSLEDLWAFNDERVARAIFHSAIPIISAVGHEPDVTISDYVADRRASTPSNAAEISVPDVRAVQDELLNLEHKLFMQVSSMLSGYRRQLDGYYHKRVLREPDAYVELRSLELDRMKERFLAAQQRNLLQKRGALVQEASALEAMSPLKVLSRGYLIGTSEDGSVLRSVRQVHTGQSINLRFSDGNAECRIKHLEEDSYVR